jgi:ribose transport system permease protein
MRDRQASNVVKNALVYVKREVRVGPLVMWAVAMLIVIATPGALTSRGIIGFTGTVAPVLLVCIGLTGAIVAGFVDFGVVQIAEVAGLAMAVDLSHGAAGLHAIVLGLCIGASVGAINGILVGFLHISSLMTTLAMSLVITGAELLYMNGPQSILLDSLRTPGSIAVTTLGRSLVGSITGVSILAVVLAVASWFAWTRTHLGRSLVYVGDGAQAAWYAGIDPRLVGLGAMTWSGVFAALGGMVFVSQSGIAIPGGIASYMVPVFAGVLVGAVIGKARRVSIATTFFGVFFISALQLFLTVHGFEAWVLKVVEGLVVGLLFAALPVASRIGKRFLKVRSSSSLAIAARPSEKGL